MKNFLKNSSLSIQLTYSAEFFIGQSTTETSLLRWYEAAYWFSFTVLNTLKFSTPDELAILKTKKKIWMEHGPMSMKDAALEQSGVLTKIFY